MIGEALRLGDAPVNGKVPIVEHRGDETQRQRRHNEEQRTLGDTRDRLLAQHLHI